MRPSLIRLLEYPVKGPPAKAGPVKDATFKRVGTFGSRALKALLDPLSDIPRDAEDAPGAKRSLGAQKKSRDESAVRVAVAVSGGVDSMALASLCAQVQKDKSSRERYHFTAMIVDHGVRSGSLTEAQVTAKTVQKLGIDAVVLSVDPSEGDPLDISHKNFESRARSLRYEALTRGIIQHKSKALVMGHHRDDQAETVLSRICSGYTGFGLRGMYSPSAIPLPQRGLPEFGIHEGQTKLHHESERNFFRSMGPGMPLIRPFLPFHKQELEKFCSERDIPWVLDETNFDRTLTLRNTVRHLFAEGSLPEALREQSLLAASSRASHMYDMSMAAVSQVFKLFYFKNIDLDVGWCEVDLSRFNAARRDGDRALGSVIQKLDMHLQDQIRNSNPPMRLSGALLLAIGRLTEVFSPAKHVPLAQAAAIAAKLADPDCPKFTGAGVQFERRPKSDIWVLTRQPVSSIEKDMTVVELGIDEPNVFCPPVSFDGRWWIRISADRACKLTLCMFTPDASYRIKNPDGGFGGSTDNNLLRIAKVVAKSARFTLPIVVDENGRVAGFPTLRLATRHGRDLGMDFSCSWKYAAALQEWMPKEFPYRRVKEELDSKKLSNKLQAQKPRPVRTETESFRLPRQSSASRKKRGAASGLKLGDVGKTWP